MVAHRGPVVEDRAALHQRPGDERRPLGLDTHHQSDRYDRATMTSRREAITTPAEPVRALPALPLALRRVRLSENVIQTLWFLPLCGAIAGWVVGRGAVAIDAAVAIDPLESGFTADRSAFGVIAATIAAATLTFLGVVFSTTLVAVQLAASQYSPRIVRLFVRSRLTQVTLAVFVATFVCAITALVTVESSEAPIVPTRTLAVMLVLVLATVFVFVAFMHGIVRLLRVQYLLRLTARSAHGSIDDAFPPADRYRSVDRPRDDPQPRLVRRGGLAGGRRETARTLQAIDLGGLAELASIHGCWVEVVVAPGNHVGPTAAVARIHGPGKAELTDALLLGSFLFGTERTLLQDPGFGIRQLVDTASRALSPAINDPTTGVQALHRVADLLERILDRPDPSGWYTDASGAARLKTAPPTFASLVRLAFIEITRYGADAPQVARALLAICDELIESASPEQASVLADQRSIIVEAIDAATTEPFRSVSREPDRGGLG